ncbi:DUF5615 family PIN-like protein [Blastococcus sp. TF02A-26]|uniref:DUF5615 family PIN-like protein n=1 Tax=Blastococcus sp. TF02A-26 TaxID=2250577 RepID=UPI000DE99C74|nr:DUF5615 family PIN-like protein [Blastococcus sp. TF02A-26]RBY88562.1 hypothetical protein DQ240_03860 [Blastococcus sp. TF02A-26]
MRFFCDHNVANSTVKALRRMGHDVWTAAEARLDDVVDDALTAYAQDRDAVVVTHDREFSQRRRRNVIGRHLWVECREMDAADLLKRSLHHFIALLEREQDLWVRLHHDGVEFGRTWD